MRLLLGLLLTTALAGPLTGQDRLVRRFDSRNGLAAVTVFSLAQDSTGFVWVGTVGGLYRFDGHAMRRWAPGRITGRVVDLEVGPDGRVLALEEGEGVWEVDGRSTLPTAGPDDTSLADAASLAADDQGALWVLRETGELWRRGPDDGWAACDRDAFAGASPTAVTARPGSGVDVATADAVWTVGVDLEPRRLASIRRVTAILPGEGGRRYLMTFLGGLYRLDPGRPPRLLFRIPGRGIDLVRRADALWLSFARHLVRYVPGGAPEVLGPAEGIEGGGPLLVDHEESLWLGTFTGLFQYPEPRTTLWGERHGLPSNHTRFLARIGDTMWISTWQGLGRLTKRGSGWRAGMEAAWQTRDVLTTDSRGRLWSGSREGLIELVAGAPVPRDPRIRFVTAAAPAAQGGLWLASGDDLFRVAPGPRDPGGAPAVRRVGGPDVPSDDWIRAVLEDDGGRLWIGYGHRICAGAVPGLDSGAGDGLDPGWRCRAVPEAGEVTDLVQMPSGALWAASSHAAVFRLRDGQWEPLPGAETLPTRSVLGLVPARRGGIWVLGHGVVQRVREVPGLDRGWRVLERLSPWHGLPASGGQDLLEEADGTMWITTARGVARIPASVWGHEPEPPRVVLVEGWVDDERIALDGPITLTHDRNRIELRFAALSYRAPSQVRYQVRLGRDAPWSTIRAQPVVRWVDLPAGAYRAQVRASLDGRRWSVPATYTFQVEPPWYRTPQWMAALGLAAILAVLLLYRVRVRHLLELERQRTRIAMDLHDEIGADLGSVGILAGVLGRKAVDPGERADLAAEIGETVEELGASLADIVWSLNPREASLYDLGARLAERGRRLFAGGGVEFVADLPADLPDTPLPARARRTVLLVGLEAMRNALRHADAERVGLSMVRIGPARWRLDIADDGVGVVPGELEKGPGIGTLSMRRRAQEIGGRIEWRRRSGGGTLISLAFPVRRRRPWSARLRRWWRRVGPPGVGR